MSTDHNRPTPKSRATPTERVILGIDPGTVAMGFGVIKEVGKSVTMIEVDVLKMEKTADHALRLKQIFERTLHLITIHHPDELAIEAQFFGKNVQSMLKLGRAQGVAIAAALHRQIPVVEYAPKRVKQAITGNGNASKEQVAAMVQNILQLRELPSSMDATDALAVALCHHFQNGPKSSGKSYSSWKGFLAKNPERSV